MILDFILQGMHQHTHPRDKYGSETLLITVKFVRYTYQHKIKKKTYLPGLVCGTSELGGILGLEGIRCDSFGTGIKQMQLLISSWQKTVRRHNITNKQIDKQETKKETLNTCLWNLNTKKAYTNNEEVWMPGTQRNSAGGEPL